MTELRDARLRKALDAAPDAQLQPHARTREAIRAAAHGAVQPAWKRWWPRAVASSPRWAGAFATVVVATLVVVMWEGREVPGARPDAERVAQAPVPASQPAPPAVQSEAPAAAAPPAMPAPAPAPRAAPAPAPARKDAGRAATATKGARSAPPLAEVQRRERAASRDAKAPVLADEAPAAAEALARAPAQAPAPDAARPFAAAPASPAATPAPAPAAGSAAPSALAQRQPEPPAVRSAPAGLPWSQVRIEAAGEAVVVAREQAGQLPALVTSLLGSPTEEAELGTAGWLRLELGQGDEAAGVLEMVGERWRWTPMGVGRPARMLAADPAVSAALQQEALRLSRR